MTNSADACATAGAKGRQAQSHSHCTGVRRPALDDGSPRADRNYGNYGDLRAIMGNYGQLWGIMVELWDIFPRIPP